MAPLTEPLDERIWRRPEIIDFYVANFPGATPMDENMVHRYIADSLYFDHMTNNGLVMAQSGTNQRFYDMSWNRAALEDDLSKKRGVEYRIVGTPAKVTEGEGWAGTGKNGMYVIRKQDRNLVRGRDGRAGEELTTLGTYYLVGENMYQAPSVGDIVGNRLMAATNYLSKAFDTAAQLPTFEPASGYTYLPHASSASRTRSTTSPTPSLSREGSLAPDTRSTSVVQDGRDGKDDSDHLLATRLLTNSMQLSLQFGGEYADENPLIGAPGNFSFAHSTAAVKKRRAEEEAAEEEARGKAAKMKLEREESVGPKKVAASPPAVMTEAKVSGKESRRGSKMVGEKVRRKKSKAANSVSTPGSTVSNGGGSKSGGGS